MDTEIPIRVFSTQAKTDFGMADVWLDESCEWNVAVEDKVFQEQVEHYSWQLMERLLSGEDKAAALAATDHHISVQLKSVVEMLNDVVGCGPGSNEWQVAFSKCSLLRRGLAQFMAAEDRFINSDDEEKEPLPKFDTRSFLIDGGQREFVLSADKAWSEMTEPSPQMPFEDVAAPCTLQMLLEYETDRRRAAPILKAHVQLIEAYAVFLVEIANRIRAGITMTRKQIESLGKRGEIAYSLNLQLIES